MDAALIEIVEKDGVFRVSAAPFLQKYWTPGTPGINHSEHQGGKYRVWSYAFPQPWQEQISAKMKEPFSEQGAEELRKLLHDGFAALLPKDMS